MAAFQNFIWHSHYLSWKTFMVNECLSQRKNITFGYDFPEECHQCALPPGCLVSNGYHGPLWCHNSLSPMATHIQLWLFFCCHNGTISELILMDFHWLLCSIVMSQCFVTHSNRHANVMTVLWLSWWDNQGADSDCSIVLTTTMGHVICPIVAMRTMGQSWLLPWPQIVDIWLLWHHKSKQLLDEAEGEYELQWWTAGCIITLAY